MKLSGMQPYEAIRNYYNLNIENATQAVTSTESAAEVTSQSSGSSTRDKLADVLEQESARSRQTYNSFDYANEYNPDATYSMKGKDSDLSSLDLPNSLANRGQDASLQQYSYFVQSNQIETKPKQTEDILENFMLY